VKEMEEKGNNCFLEGATEDDYIVIGALSMGDPILCEKDSDRISIYNLEAGRIEEDESYPDFFSFLRDLENIIGMEV